MEDDIPRGGINQGASQAPPIPNFPQGHSNPTRVTTGAELRSHFIKLFKDKRQWSRVSAEPEPAQRRALVVSFHLNFLYIDYATVSQSIGVSRSLLAMAIVLLRKSF